MIPFYCGGIMKILVVDDDEMVVTLLCDAVKASGFIPKGCLHGVEALGMIKEFTPDLVILDVLMPDMSGIEVLQLIRQLYPELKVLLFSGMSSHTTSKLVKTTDPHLYILDKYISFKDLQDFLTNFEKNRGV